jgi:hypothetical protein
MHGFETPECLIKVSRSVSTLIGLYHPLDGITNPKYNLLFFLKTIFFCKEKKALAFNQDRCCHLALCLRLILFYWNLGREVGTEVNINNCCKSVLHKVTKKIKCFKELIFFLFSEVQICDWPSKVKLLRPGTNFINILQL